MQPLKLTASVRGKRGIQSKDTGHTRLGGQVGFGRKFPSTTMGISNYPYEGLNQKSDMM